MTESSPRYMRFVIDLEVEVVDLIQAAAFRSDWGTDEQGNLGMLAPLDPHLDVASTIQRAVGLTLVDAERTGLRLVGASVLPRFAGEDGLYGALPLPAMPARGDDGEYLVEWP